MIKNKFLKPRLQAVVWSSSRASPRARAGRSSEWVLGKTGKSDWVLGKSGKSDWVLGKSGKSDWVLGKTGKSDWVLGKTNKSDWVLGKTGKCDWVLGKTGKWYVVQTSHVLPGGSGWCGLQFQPSAVAGPQNAEMIRAVLTSLAWPLWLSVSRNTGTVTTLSSWLRIRRQFLCLELESGVYGLLSLYIAGSGVAQFLSHFTMSHCNVTGAKMLSFVTWTCTRVRETVEAWHTWSWNVVCLCTFPADRRKPWFCKECFHVSKPCYLHRNILRRSLCSKFVRSLFLTSQLPPLKKN